MKDYLLMMGYTEKDIKDLLELGKLKDIDGEIIIVDDILFTDYIINLLDLSIDPTVYFEKEKNDNSYLYHIYRYIDTHMYAEAAYLLSIYNKDYPNCYYSHLLYDGLLKLEDKTEYILEDDKYESDVVKNNLKRKELELLATIELDQQKESYRLTKELKQLYSAHQESLPFVVIAELMMELRRLSTNHRRVSKHTDLTCTGDFDSVMLGLLKEQDYYRLERFLKEEIDSKSNPSIKLEIYNALVDELVYLNAQNLKYIKDSMVIDVESKSLEETIKYNHIPYMTDEFITQLLNPPIVEKHDTNYYSIYEEHLKKKEYVKAREALVKFDADMKRMNIFKDVDYQLNELSILINMKDTLTEEEMSQYEKECDEIDSLIKDNNYMDAITRLVKLEKDDRYSNPFISNKIGLCYYSLKNYPKAIEYYSKAKQGFIYPEDIYNLIYSYFKVGRYNKALALIPRYDYYYPEENIKLYYIESICHVKLKEYAEAIDSLESCEAMNVIYYNMPIEYRREKEIIDKIKNGKNISCYTEDDFVSYDLTDDEVKLRNEIAKGETTLPNLIRLGTLKKYGLRDKIEYLLSCAKVYLQMGLEDEGTELCRFINSMLQDPRLDNKEKETFTLRLKNYTTL